MMRGNTLLLCSLGLPFPALLGAAVGEDAFVAAHASERATAPSQLLDAISGLDDPQVGLRLLRSSGGHFRLVHSMRCTPPAAQLDSFKAFDQGARACFSSFTGLHMHNGSKLLGDLTRLGWGCALPTWMGQPPT